jgi:hypothetical protein
LKAEEVSPLNEASGMFPMEKKIDDLVMELNQVLTSFPWMDFEVWEYTQYRLTICGSLDTTRPGDVFIYFDDIAYVSLPFNWKTSTSQDVFSLVSGPEARKLNIRFGVEIGHYNFKFVPEYMPNNTFCYVGAKSLSWRKG